MIESLEYNLALTGVFMGLLALSWFSNFSCSLWYNVKFLHESFDKAKMLNGLLKLISLCLGIASFVIVITAVPIVLTEVNIPIPDDFTELFSIATILGVFLTKGIIPYCMEAYTTFTNIISKSE